MLFTILYIVMSMNRFDTKLWLLLNSLLVVGHPEPEKKNSVGIFEYILASMLKVYLDVF